MKKIILFVATALMVNFVSCSNEKTLNIDGEWKIVSIGTEEVPETMQEVALTFDSKTNNYYGMTGVNTVNGSFSLKDQHLTLNEGAMTRMMGDSISNEVEIKYINAIHTTVTVNKQEEVLILQDDKGNQLMKLVRK